MFFVYSYLTLFQNRVTGAKALQEELRSKNEELKRKDLKNCKRIMSIGTLPIYPREMRDKIKGTLNAQEDLPKTD